MGQKQSKPKQSATKFYLTVYYLLDLEPGFFRKPFVSITLGNETVLTKFGVPLKTEDNQSLKQVTNYEFLERYCFEDVVDNQEVHIEVWDSGFCFANELVGELTFPINPFYREEKRLIFQLFHEHEDEPGHIELGMYLCPPGFTVEGKETYLSYSTDGVIVPPKPLHVPPIPTTPSVPYYVLLDYPSFNSVISNPSAFGLFLLNGRAAAKAKEAEAAQRLRQRIVQLARQKEVKRAEGDMERVKEMETIIERAMAHAQVAADSSFLDLNETREEAEEMNKKILAVEMKAFNKRISEMKKLEMKEKEQRKLAKKREDEEKKRQANQLRAQLRPGSRSNAINALPTDEPLSEGQSINAVIPSDSSSSALQQNFVDPNSKPPTPESGRVSPLVAHPASAPSPQLLQPTQMYTPANVAAASAASAAAAPTPNCSRPSSSMVSPVANSIGTGSSQLQSQSPQTNPAGVMETTLSSDTSHSPYQSSLRVSPPFLSPANAPGQFQQQTPFLSPEHTPTRPLSSMLPPNPASALSTPHLTPTGTATPSLVASATSSPFAPLAATPLPRPTSSALVSAYPSGNDGVGPSPTRPKSSMVV
ncbi:uncharacterized protein MONOS_2085 [Monocercomonoides exilis]|uniref:uncharacterized protein n=1 Tax=Monocercomonoides exilis TaxID=2049356 RepID=UPI00355A7C99|nr:hypothetical protein MONOS_2085 [Monocercomonoides exilis]|eukprot:MONOS_2085.1-p1 / transcript=MONOS_2085.1 / gene=MONOS_2085 / organism=Monocercomonoides_exilis_PA203 / gene_product=unspecified product / transcript_product=unspecified product / location=Mono_scaffold00041:7621-9646(+) / protein_length=590 / sequence_SO=supercontig / SO=protein_coding / is_pseudo=false